MGIVESVSLVVKIVHKENLSAMEQIKLLATIFLCIHQDPTLFVSASPPRHHIHEKQLAGQLGVTGTNVNHRNELKETPLHIAAKKDFLKAAKHLIEKGANLEAKDKWGDTPLHIAASQNAHQVAQILIQEGADVNARGSNKYTPLHWAAGISQKVAKVLIENGADLEAKDKWGDRPLHHAASYNAHQVARLLIQEGANVEAIGTNGMNWTPLHWAAYKNGLQVATVLVQEGQANKDAEVRGRKPIDIACNFHPKSPKCSKMRNLLQ